MLFLGWLISLGFCYYFYSVLVALQDSWLGVVAGFLGAASAIVVIVLTFMLFTARAD